MGKDWKQEKEDMTEVQRYVGAIILTCDEIREIACDSLDEDDQEILDTLLNQIEKWSYKIESLTPY